MIWRLLSVCLFLVYRVENCRTFITLKRIKVITRVTTLQRFRYLKTAEHLLHFISQNQSHYSSNHFAEVSVFDIIPSSVHGAILHFILQLQHSNIL